MPHRSCDCATCADDVLFVEMLLNELERTLCVDTTRVFLTGMSNGAMMVYQLAQSRIASRFAAVVPVSGSPLLGFGTEVSEVEFDRYSPATLFCLFLHRSEIITLPSLQLHTTFSFLLTTPIISTNFSAVYILVLIFVE